MIVKVIYAIAIFFLGQVVTNFSLQASPSVVKQRGKCDNSYDHHGKHIKNCLHPSVVF